MFNYYSIAAVVAATVISMTMFSRDGLSIDPTSEDVGRRDIIAGNLNCGPTADQVQMYRCQQAMQGDIIR